jgi:hypothetical protein
VNRTIIGLDVHAKSFAVAAADSDAVTAPQDSTGVRFSLTLSQETPSRAKDGRSTIRSGVAGVGVAHGVQRQGR